MDSNTNTKEAYLSSKEAGQILGYTHDYVSRLCRQGHMVGVRKGREWYVKPSDIELFKQKHEVVLQEKKKQLSQKLSVIRKKHEAQKRQSKKQVVVEEKIIEEPAITVVCESAQQSGPHETPQAISKKEEVKIAIPKQLIAIGVLALLLLMPSVMNSISSVPKSNAPAAVSQSGSISESFVTSIVELPGDTVGTIGSIGNTYLIVYQLQGQTIYESMQQVSKIGATVLSGYELVGDSFWFGSKDIINKVGDGVGSVIKTSQKKTLNFVNSVSGGYSYASGQFFFAFNTGIIGSISQGVGLVASNISQNISAMSTTVNSISYSIHASIGSVFSNSKNNNYNSVRVIPVR